MKVLLNNWKLAFKQKNFLLKVLITIPILTIVLICVTEFLTFNEYRAGNVINDFVLNLISPVNLKYTIFLLTYLIVIFGVFSIISKPKVVLITLHSYIIILILRMVTMYLFPLEPPKGIIPLHDIILESSFYSGRLNLKDLFFSGHIATVFLFYLVIDNKTIKIFFLILTFIVAICLLLQHIHYTIDIVFAPLFTLISYKFAKLINKY
ncbi:MAG: hypothetical protein A2X08_00280 [Bacteroidetes bacterium GWA2_32_17]|nr:MAG: hypothetical protein A2X08_00280 [Bacteroidetes bacterium GWA2_32_17]